MFLRILYVTIAIVAIFAGYKAWDFYSTRSAAEKVPAEYIIGPEKADLSVVIFLDYQCPYCKDIYPTIKEAAEKDGNVRLILRFIPAMGEESARIERLAFAAVLQGKFREVNDILITHYGPFDNADLKRVAEETGMDLDQWLADSEKEEMQKQLDDNMAMARKLGVMATPTFLAGKLIYVPIEKLPEVEDFLRLFAEAREA
jgi:protein-disulfide isomerase